MNRPTLSPKVARTVLAMMREVADSAAADDPTGAPHDLAAGAWCQLLGRVEFLAGDVDAQLLPVQIWRRAHGDEAQP